MRHSPSELFGERYYEFTDAERSVIDHALADGVIDEGDFVRMDESGTMPTSRGSEWEGGYYRRDGIRMHSHEFMFLRRIYFHLRRFSASDGDCDRLSKAEAGAFRRWFSTEGPASIHKGAIVDMIGEELLCPLLTDQYGRCDAIPIEESAFMLVVHPSSDFDEYSRSAEGIDAEVHAASEHDIPVTYLVQGWDSFDDFSLHEMTPDLFVRSHAGFHSIRFDGPSVIMAGGYLTKCFRNAFRELLRRRTVSDPLTIEMPTDAIYMRRPNEYVSMTLEGVLAAEADPLPYLVERVRELSDPLASDIDTGFDAVNESYRYTVCLDEECITTSIGEERDPEVRVVFRSQR